MAELQAGQITAHGEQRLHLPLLILRVAAEGVQKMINRDILAVQAEEVQQEAVQQEQGIFPQLPPLKAMMEAVERLATYRQEAVVEVVLSAVTVLAVHQVMVETAQPILFLVRLLRGQAAAVVVREVMGRKVLAGLAAVGLEAITLTERLALQTREEAEEAEVVNQITQLLEMEVPAAPASSSFLISRIASPQLAGQLQLMEIKRSTLSLVAAHLP